MPSIPFHLFSRLILISFVVLVSTLISPSQEFGGFPPHITWKQINTDSLRIIFPQPLEHSAQRLANAVSVLRKKETPEVGERSFKIDMVLHNQTTISNGFVGLAPWRSYLYTTPLQNSFQATALPWLDYLAIHEYRHVLQFSNSRNGISKVLYYLFGEEAWAGAVNLAIPDWYFEGDAVWAETNLTSQGRGVIPSFMTGYRSLWAEDNLPNYTRARNGSVSDFIPDHYRLGYLMVRYGYKHYGSDFWKIILREASGYKYIFYPFEKALEKHSGLSIQEFYHRAIDDFRQDNWEPENESGSVQVVMPKGELTTYTDYLYPGFIDDNLIYFKKSYEKTGAFYYLDKEKKEHKLVNRGISSNDYFSVAGSRLVWTELYTHPRWIEQNYQEIMLFNVESGVKERVTKRGKFFSPDVDDSGTRIVAVRVDEQTDVNLVILDASTGEVIRTLPNKYDWFFTYPKWSDDSQLIFSSVRNKEGQMSIIKIDPESGNTNMLLPFRNTIIGVPSVTNDHLIFSMGSPEIENIYALDPHSKEVNQITKSVAGAFQPSVLHDSVYFVEFTHLGYRILCQPVGASFQKRQNYPSTEPAGSSDVSSIMSEVPNKNYEVKKYSPWLNAINFHSWGFNFESSSLVLRALSTNVLNNVEFAGGLRFETENENELLIRPGSIKLNPFARISLAILYPQLNMEVSTIKRSAQVENRSFEWQETTLSSSLSVHLNYSSGLYTRTFLPWFGFDQTMARGDIRENLSSVKAGLLFLQSRIKARKNIFSRNGQFIYLLFRESVDELQAREFSLRTAWAFPGLGQNHSFIVHADYQSENPENDYRFGDSFSFPRGSISTRYDEILKLGGNYHFPLIYPDFGFSGLLYFYRIRGNFFYDWSNIKLGRNWEMVSSVGVEIVFDLNIFNALPLSIGVRYSRVFNQPGRTNHVSFFVPISRF